LAPRHLICIQEEQNEEKRRSYDDDDDDGADDDDGGALTFWQMTLSKMPLTRMTCSKTDAEFSFRGIVKILLC
jgi:hypothetical protein